MLSVYRSSNDTHGSTVTLQAVRERILDGKRGLDEKTRYCNATAITDTKVYKGYKEKNLPAVTFSGTFPKGKRKAQHLIRHSGYITIDVDSLTAEQISSLLAELAQMPHVVMAFISPSGKGIKVIVRVNPIPTNDLEHKGAYQACLDFFEDLADEYGFTIDTSGSDCSRLCYLAHDPLAIFHEDTPEIDWDKDAWIQEQVKRQQQLEAASANFEGEADLAALDYIPNDCEYETWRNIGMAIKHAGFGVDIFQKWTGGQRKRSTGESVDEDILSHWGRFQRTTGKIATWGTVVFLAKENGYTPPHREQRYTSNKDYVHTTSDIETERGGNKNKLLKWLEKTENAKGYYMLVLGGAAGTAKTTLTTTEVELLLYIAKTTGEADNLFKVLHDAEEDVMRHRSRMFNYNHPDWETLPLGLGDNEKPCDKPVLCNEHAAKLGSPNEVCHRCSLYAECKENGYLSQAEKERNTSKVIYAWNESFICDETLKARLKRICTKDKVFILDEANPLGFTQLRTIDRAMLFDLTERFRHTLGTGHEIYRKLKSLLDLISTVEEPSDFINGLSDWIDTLDDIETLNEKIGKFPVSITFRKTPETVRHDQPFEATLRYSDKEVTVPVVDFETADDTPVFFIDPYTPITVGVNETRFLPYGFLLKVGIASLNEPPRRYQNFVKDIKSFLAENKTLESAPFTFDAKEQSFSFHLKPTLNHRRVIVNTASDPDNLISEAYRETPVNITRHTGTPPAWKTDLVFQIASGAYLPRHSLIAKDGKKLVLKKYAEDMIESFIKPSVESGLKTLVIAPKAFQEVESVSEWAVTDQNDYIPGEKAILTNHHRAEGRNDYQDCDIVFEFHYEPNHHDIQADAKHIYRNAETPLDFTREKKTIEVNGVSFQKNVYPDERAQAVYNRECRSRLMQGGMRLRPNIHSDKIICYLTAEPIDIPVTPVPFTPADKDKFTGDWADFKKKLQASPQERIAAGESKSKAYRDGKDSNKKKKADRDAQVLALHQQGKNKSEIHRETDVPRGTILDIIKRYEGGDENSQSTIDSTYSRMGNSVTPTNPDDTHVECKILNASESEPNHDTFFKLLEIRTCFYEKKQLSASDISQLTGIDESEVRKILEYWYKNVVISPGIGDQYWMTERDKKQLWEKILGTAFNEWGENFSGQKTLCPPITFQWIGTGPGDGIHVLP